MYMQGKKPTNMSKKTTLIARRAWKILRLALQWPTKGGLFGNRLSTISLQAFAKVIRKISHSNERSRGPLHYGDHEFSFDETPLFHVNMRRASSNSMRFRMPLISCIKPQGAVDFEWDNDDLMIGDDKISSGGRFLKDGEELEEKEERNIEDCGDEGIDLKAEEFIAKFYEQLKLQKQISYLHAVQ